MIKLFGITDTDFTSNGDKVIIPTKAVIHKEDNGSYYLDLETDLSYVNDLTANKIIVANTPNGEQAFRITTVYQNSTKITIKAYHVFYDTENYLIADSYVVDNDCNYALDHFNAATDNPSPFTTSSNITATNTFRCVRKSFYEAIQTIIERWGGHLVRDNFNIAINSTIGTDNGVTVRYGKNIKEISAEYNWDNVVTKLMPVGTDGLLLDEKYVYSNTQYDIPYTKTISFDQSEIVQEDYTDANGDPDIDAYNQALINDLRNQAQNYVDNNCIPSINYTLRANLEKITDIGDTVGVYDERLNISLLTNIISYDYDCILEQYKEVQFGNFNPKLSDLMSTINTNTQNTVNEANSVVKVTLGQELEKATNQIWGVLGNSYVIYEGDKILVVDQLPKEDATNVLMINSGGIGFSNTGINGTFSSAWTIDNVLNMENINVINLTADLIKGGTLKLGSNLNDYGLLEVYDEANNLVAQLDKNGLKMYGVDGSYIVMNNEVGFCGYDRLGNQIYWVSEDEFHMKKSVVEEEITLCNKMRFIPITLADTYNDYNGNSHTLVSTNGIGLVSVASTYTPAENLAMISKSNISSELYTDENFRTKYGRNVVDSREPSAVVVPNSVDATVWVKTNYNTSSTPTMIAEIGYTIPRFLPDDTVVEDPEQCELQTKECYIKSVETIISTKLYFIKKYEISIAADLDEREYPYMYHIRNIYLDIDGHQTNKNGLDYWLSGSVERACFTGDMKVSTKEGYKNISDIQIGDKVLSYNGTKQEYKEVDKLVSHDTNLIYVINGIKVTGSHPVYTDKGIKLVKDLTTEEKLINIKNELINIDSIDTKSVKEKVYEIRVKDNNNYYVENILVHNEDYIL